MGSGLGPLARTTRSAKNTYRDNWIFVISDRGSRTDFVSCGHRLMRTIKPIELLVTVSFKHCCSSTPVLSTWWSSTALIGNTRFEGGFLLRCFQQLSRPNL